MKWSSGGGWTLEDLIEEYQQTMDVTLVSSTLNTSQLTKVPQWWFDAMRSGNRSRPLIGTIHVEVSGKMRVALMQILTSLDWHKSRNISSSCDCVAIVLADGWFFFGSDESVDVASEKRKWKTTWLARLWSSSVILVIGSPESHFLQ